MMRRWVLFSSGFVACAGALGVWASPAFAHEKWFQNPDGFPLRWDLFFRPLPLAFVGLALLATLAAALLWRSRDGRGFLPGPLAFGATDERRRVLYGILPVILGVHVAVPLLVNGVQGTLFSPDNELPGVWANFLGFAETFVALSLFYGAFTRIAAGALGAIWVIGVFVLGLEPMLDNALYLGFAAFFFLAGRGPISIDRVLFPRLEPPERTAPYAVPALRAGLGLGFIAVAFSEKFANLPLAQAFLDEYPLNFTGALGIPLSDEVFILCAGTVELMLGLFILSGVFVREIVLLALVPTNLTLTVFNWNELIGHLPIYGALALLLIWEPGRKNLLLWIDGLHNSPSTTLSSAKANAPDAADRDD